jgi:flagellar basal-body rod modification protein FlgD
MAVSATNSAGSSDSATKYTRDTSKDSRDMTIDTATFLNMLVTQLKYQDPLSPQDNSQFVSQMAQMSSLSAMKDMSNSLENSRAYDMIGKEIYAVVTDTVTKEKTEYTGIVTSVAVKDGVPYVVVGNKMISVKDVLQVMPDPAKYDVNLSLKSSQALDMIGKQIYAEVKDTATGAVSKYTGVVESVVLKDGIPYVVVGGQAISVDNVLKVSPPPSSAADTTGSGTSTTGSGTTAAVAASTDASNSSGTGTQTTTGSV